MANPFVRENVVCCKDEVFSSWSRDHELFSKCHWDNRSFGGESRGGLFTSWHMANINSILELAATAAQLRMLTTTEFYTLTA